MKSISRSVVASFDEVTGSEQVIPAVLVMIQFPVTLLILVISCWADKRFLLFCPYVRPSVRYNIYLVTRLSLLLVLGSSPKLQ